MKFLTATCASLLPEGEGAPVWVMLMPIGDINADDGRKFKNADMVGVLKASDAKIDLVIDYEHQTDYAQKNGQPAPAAGWIKELSGRTDGIWGRVEWTEKAKAHLAAKEFRYLSPTFLHDKAGNVKRILRAALLNNPAIHELPALAKSQQTGNHVMDEEEYLALCQALGMPVGTTVEAVLAAVEAAQQAAASTTTTTAALCSSLDLAESATAEDIATAITSLKATATVDKVDPAQYVGMAAHQEVASSLKALQDELVRKGASEAVEKAMLVGKVTPANKDWALALATKDPASFDDFMKNAPIIVDPGSVVHGGAVKAKASSLDDDEKAMCASLGITEEAFLKSKNEGID